MNLTDIAPAEVWRELARDIYDTFGYNGGIADKEGALIHPPLGWANKVCPAIKGCNESRVVCASAQQNLAGMAYKSKKLTIGQCDVGFTKFVIPLFFHGTFMGTAGGCGILIEGDELEDFYISKLLRMEEEHVQELIKTVNTTPRDTLKAAVQYVQYRTSDIVSSS